jgi:hypothetical protein
LLLLLLLTSGFGLEPLRMPMFSERAFRSKALSLALDSHLQQGNDDLRVRLVLIARLARMWRQVRYVFLL